MPQVRRSTRMLRSRPRALAGTGGLAVRYSVVPNAQCWSASRGRGRAATGSATATAVLALEKAIADFFARSTRSLPTAGARVP